MPCVPRVLARPLVVLASLASLAAMGCASSPVGSAASPSSSSSSELREVVLVHIVTRDAVLEVAERDGWKRVCAAPCGDEVLLHARYRLVTADTDYPPFEIDAKPNARVDLEAHPGTGGLAGVGVGVIVVGALIIPAGFVYWITENIGNGDRGKSDVPSDNVNHTTYAGVGIMIAGVLGVALGIGLVVTSRPDEVAQRSRPRARKKAATLDRVRGAAETWRTPDEIDRRAPRVTSVPLFSVSF